MARGWTTAKEKADAYDFIRDAVERIDDDPVVTIRVRKMGVLVRLVKDGWETSKIVSWAVLERSNANPILAAYKACQLELARAGRAA